MMSHHQALLDRIYQMRWPNLKIKCSCETNHFEKHLSEKEKTFCKGILFIERDKEVGSS